MKNRMIEIDYTNNPHAFKWQWALITLIQLTLAFYIFNDNQFFKSIYQYTLGVYVIGCLFILPKLRIKKALGNRALYVVMAIFVVNWLLMAHTIRVIWNEELSAEKMLLIGFFSMLIYFNTSKFLLILSTAPLVAAYMFYQIYYVEMSNMELLFSFIKFPLFIFAIIVTHVNHSNRLIESHKQLTILNSELTILRNIDSLTDLFNRRAFDEKLKYILDLHNRMHQPVSLMILDVDFFKKYNDSLGHPQGDACLKKISAAMTAAIWRETDVIARIGGEEFGIILPNTTIKDCQILAQRLIESVKETAIIHPNSDVSSLVTVSIGCACINGTITTPEAIYYKADKALYVAKETGRNRFSV
jgi:diguanylate cyclase (GGDEF)-like protein